MRKFSYLKVGLRISKLKGGAVRVEKKLGIGVTIGITEMQENLGRDDLI